VVESLSLTSAALHGEPWRLWTGHAVHYDLRHLLLDSVAALPPLALMGRPHPPLRGTLSRKRERDLAREALLCRTHPPLRGTAREPSPRVSGERVVLTLSEAKGKDRVRGVRTWWLLSWAFVVAPLISIAILLTTPNVEYRGMSALVVGLWILVPLHCIRERGVFAAALLILCITRLAFEAFTPFRLGFTPIPPLFLAHWSGALAGAMTFALTRLR
jgi:hypothetical protein